MSQISEEERELILKESQSFLNEFSRKLDKIKEDLNEETHKSEARKELSGWNPDPDFKETILQNSPFVNEDLIIAEKGAWKK